MINAGLNNIFFFSLANHSLTVVATDASYVKPFKTSYIAISPGQTIDVLVQANQPSGRYYMAARAYNSAARVSFDNTTTTAIFTYKGAAATTAPPMPNLPVYNDINASVNFTGSLRSLASKSHPIQVPLKVDTKLLFTISINTEPCENNRNCTGPGGTRFAASVNNVTFDSPTIDLLEAYYKRITGVYEDDFPKKPPVKFNYTGDSIPAAFRLPRRATEVRELRYNSTVELVFQGTNLVAGIDHPMHLHGYSFYVVGWGFGNFDKDKDPEKYNLVDPPLQNTIAVPRNGWSAIRFKANNPGEYINF
jgi:laccase